MCDVCGTSAHDYVPSGEGRKPNEITGKPWCKVCGRGERSHVHIAAIKSGVPHEDPCDCDQCRQAVQG
jgi:hypothetical protein